MRKQSLTKQELHVIHVLYPYRKSAAWSKGLKRRFYGERVNTIAWS